MFNQFRRLYIPILTQITVPYIILAAVLAAGGTYLITRVIFDSVEERFTNQLIETGKLAQESVVREEDQLLEALRLVSHIQGVDEAIVASEGSTLQTLILPVAFNSQLDAVVILDAKGRPRMAMAYNAATQNYGRLAGADSLARMDFVSKVLKGQSDELGDKFGGLAALSDGQYFFVAGPVSDANGALVGAALIGRTIEGLTQLIRAETLAQVSFYDLKGQVIDTTLLGKQAIQADQANEIVSVQEQGSLLRAFSESDITYNELLSTFEIRAGEDIGLMGVALPTHFLVQANQITRSNTLLLMAAGLFAVIAVGLFVARRITRPIENLKEAAVKVAGGNLEIKVAEGRRDELGVLTESFNEMVTSLSQSKRDLVDAYDKTLEGWARAMDLRDHETEDHSRRVAQLSVRLASLMGIKGDELEQLYRGALLHDIGKIGIPDQILLKQGSLTNAERKTMQQHPLFARQFIEQIDYLKPSLDIPYSHHEKWDGSGYPKKLKGENIPLAARIFAVVDVWDAITSDRRYHKAMPVHKAMNLIEAESGKHFDPKVVKVFLEMIGEMVKEKQAAH